MPLYLIGSELLCLLFHEALSSANVERRKPFTQRKMGQVVSGTTTTRQLFPQMLLEKCSSQAMGKKWQR